MIKRFSLSLTLLQLGVAVVLAAPERQRRPALRPRPTSRKRSKNAIAPALRANRQVHKDAKGNLVDHGIVETYYEKGARMGRYVFRNGLHDGPWVEWYESGQKKGEGTYSREKKEGTEPAITPMARKSRKPITRTM